MIALHENGKINDFRLLFSRFFSSYIVQANETQQRRRLHCQIALFRVHFSFFVFRRSSLVRLTLCVISNISSCAQRAPFYRFQLHFIPSEICELAMKCMIVLASSFRSFSSSSSLCVRRLSVYIVALSDSSFTFFSLFVVVLWFFCDTLCLKYKHKPRKLRPVIS